MARFPIRLIRVLGTTLITPRMKRVTFGGPDLADFVCAGPDQQVRLYFPRPGQAVPRVPPAPADGDMRTWYRAFEDIPEPERPPTRGYTIRSHDPGLGVVSIDFGLHGGSGPAVRWVESAAPGDVLAMFGPPPRYTRPIPMADTMRDVAWTLIVGDDSALPAIGTLIEALPEGCRATAFVEVADRAEEQAFATKGDVDVHWLHRGARPPGRGRALLDAVRGADLPPGPVFAWLAGEASQVRDLRRHLVNERGIDKRSIDFTGYWRAQLAEDDARSEEDLADEREWEAYFQGLVDEAEGRRIRAAAPSTAPFDRACATEGAAPWRTGEPQPALAGLERAGLIRGRVLDVGCGTGEYTILLAGLGYDVHGIDFSEQAVRRARGNAAGSGTGVRFTVADARALDEEPGYDTVVDSGLMHVLAPEDRAAYVRSLHRATRPGGVVHVLALAERGAEAEARKDVESAEGTEGTEGGIGRTALAAAFDEGWRVEELSASHYRIARGGNHAVRELPGWLARVRRL